MHLQTRMYLLCNAEKRSEIPVFKISYFYLSGTRIMGEESAGRC